MKKLITILMIFLFFSCQNIKRINERTYNTKHDLLDVKVDDEGDYHFISTYGTYTDISGYHVNLKVQGTEMILLIEWNDYDNNPNSPWDTQNYTIIIPETFKIEIFND